MELTKQVPTLELCKKLKELGYPQEVEELKWGGNFAYADRHLVGITSLGMGVEVFNGTFGCGATSGEPDIYGLDEYEEVIVAPTVAELGEWLPQGFFTAKGLKWRSWFDDTDNSFEWKESDEFDPIDEETEANARAKMLIWLVENEYLEFNNEQ